MLNILQCIVTIVKGSYYLLAFGYLNLQVCILYIHSFTNLVLIHAYAKCFLLPSQFEKAIVAFDFLNLMKCFLLVQAHASREGISSQN